MTLIILDGVWLGLIASSLYHDSIGHLCNLVDGRMVVNYGAAAVVYIALVAGIHIFIIPSSTSSFTAMTQGLLFGIITYGIYDFTNLAILRAWPLSISLIDVAWGGTLCAITSAVTFILIM